MVIYYAQHSGFHAKELSLAFLSHLHVFRAPEDRDTGWHQLPSAIGSQPVPGKQNRQKDNAAVPRAQSRSRPLHRAAAPSVSSSRWQRITRVTRAGTAQTPRSPGLRHPAMEGTGAALAPATSLKPRHSWRTGELQLK